MWYKWSTNDKDFNAWISNWCVGCTLMLRRLFTQCWSYDAIFTWKENKKQNLLVNIINDLQTNRLLKIRLKCPSLEFVLKTVDILSLIFFKRKFPKPSKTNTHVNTVSTLFPQSSSEKHPSRPPSQTIATENPPKLPQEAPFRWVLNQHGAGDSPTMVAASTLGSKLHVATSTTTTTDVSSRPSWRDSTESLPLFTQHQQQQLQRPR